MQTVLYLNLNKLIGKNADDDDIIHAFRITCQTHEIIKSIR